VFLKLKRKKKALEKLFSLLEEAVKEKLPMRAEGGFSGRRDWLLQNIPSRETRESGE
jgi:hypothetical protein